jgi:autotransporter-associated beta strand protein
VATIRTTANAGSSGSTASGGNVTKQGNGVLTLAGVNEFTGLLTLTAGGINVSSAGYLCSNLCDVAVNGGTLSLSNAAQTIENLFGTGGTVYLASGTTLTINPVNATRSSTYSGVLSGDGSIVKIGGPTETLAGANTYTGSSTVSAGKLVTTTATTGAGTYTVGSGTTLGTRVAVAGTSLNMSALTAATAVMEFDLNRLGIPTAPIINVTGPITVNANVTVDVKGFTTTGTFTLLQYSGTRSGAGSFVLGTLPPRAAAILTDDTRQPEGHSPNHGRHRFLDLGRRCQWSWDTNNPANLVWKLASDGTPTEYRENALQGDSVRFDDTVTGTNGITLVTNVNPFTAVVDNSTIHYRFLGNGKLTGIAALTKSGSAQLTIATTNDHSGGSTVNAGIVDVATSAVFGTGKLTVNGGLIRSDGVTARTLTMPTDLNANIVLGDPVNNGNLTFSTGAWRITGGSRVISVDTINATISSVIGQDSSGRALTKVGGGILSLTAANTFSGGVTHSAGTLRVNNNAALGVANSPVSYADGVTLSTTAGTGRTLTYAHTINGNLTIGQASGGNATLTLAGSVDLAGGARTLNTVTNLTISESLAMGRSSRKGQPPCCWAMQAIFTREPPPSMAGYCPLTQTPPSAMEPAR